MTTQQRDQAMLALFEDGMSVEEISAQFGITPARVGDIIRRQRLLRGFETGDWRGVRKPPET